MAVEKEGKAEVVDEFNIHNKNHNGDPVHQVIRLIENEGKMALSITKRVTCKPDQDVMNLGFRTESVNSDAGTVTYVQNFSLKLETLEKINDFLKQVEW